MAGAEERNKGSIQFLVGEAGSLFNKQLLAGADPVDLMHKMVNNLGVWAAPLVLGREDAEPNRRFFGLWKAIPKRLEDVPQDERALLDDDLFIEHRRYKQLAAYSCLFYDHGILTKQDVPFFDANPTEE